MLKAHNIISPLLILVSSAINLAYAQQTVTPQDIERFGWEYLEQTVIMTVFLDDVYACRQPSNRGKVCTYMTYRNETYMEALFAEGFTRNDILPFIENCVDMIGTVVEVDTQTSGAMTTVPALNIEAIEVSGNICE